jgi:uncharacterized membrane protein YqhA
MWLNIVVYTEMMSNMFDILAEALSELREGTDSVKTIIMIVGAITLFIIGLLLLIYGQSFLKDFAGSLGIGDIMNIFGDLK